MHARAADLIKELDLSPHPEGGYFRQNHRSSYSVRPLEDGRPERPALTHIYFLLVAGQQSRWHRVLSDEAWHFYEGDPLELWSMDSEFSQVRREELGPVGPNSRPSRVIAAGLWQAARSLGDYTLVGCSVGPGFDFDDFQLLSELAPESEKLHIRQPETESLL